MQLKLISALALTLAAGSLAAACSDDSSSSSTTGSTCTGTSTGGTENKACSDCVLANCSSEYNACFGGGKACSAWANAGCKGIPDSACINCATSLGTCQQSKCASQCKSTTADTGVTDTDTTGGGCTALAGCCSQLMAGDAKTGCDNLVVAANDTNCSSAHSGYKAAGLCK